MHTSIWLKMISDLNVDVTKVVGVGGTHLIFLRFISLKLAVQFGRVHNNYPLSLIAEQFIVFGKKK